MPCKKWDRQIRGGNRGPGSQERIRLVSGVDGIPKDPACLGTGSFGVRIIPGGGDWDSRRR